MAKGLLLHSGQRGLQSRVQEDLKVSSQRFRVQLFDAQPTVVEAQFLILLFTELMKGQQLGLPYPDVFKRPGQALRVPDAHIERNK